VALAWGDDVNEARVRAKLCAGKVKPVEAGSPASEAPVPA
jgi:hypothetical protein